MVSEDAKLSTRRHWSVLVGPWIVSLAVAVLAVLLGVVPLWVAASPGLWLAWKMTSWSFEEIIVTDDRIMWRSGIITRQVALVTLAHVAEAGWKQGVLGRILGYGEVTVETTSQDRKITKFDHIPNPAGFCATVLSLSRGRDPWEV